MCTLANLSNLFPEITMRLEFTNLDQKHLDQKHLDQKHLDQKLPTQQS